MPVWKKENPLFGGFYARCMKKQALEWHRDNNPESLNPRRNRESKIRKREKVSSNSNGTNDWIL